MHACMQVSLLDTSQPLSLEGVVPAVTALVGPPHNYSAINPTPFDSQPAQVSAPAAAPAAADEAGASQAEQLTPEQVTLLR